MTKNPSQPVAELRRESERTRAELSETVGTLRGKITDTAEDIRQKVSPAYVKAEVSEYVAEKGRHWVGTLKQQAMDNPMQALAAGTAIAVPAFKIVRTVPLPLLMIGVGLALASSRVRDVATCQMLATSNGESAVNQAAEAARDGWQSGRSPADSPIDQTRRGLHDAQDAVVGTAADIRGTTMQPAGDLKDRATQYGSAAGEMLSAKASAASDAAKEVFDATRAKAAETFRRTHGSIERVVRDNAALVGGIGLAIGALIAASLPSTRTEAATMSEASDSLRHQAARAAAEKFDELKTAAMSAAESAAGKISDAALGCEARRASEKAPDMLKTVADETVTTAFEPSQTNQPLNTRGRP